MPSTMGTSGMRRSASGRSNLDFDVDRSAQTPQPAYEAIQADTGALAGQQPGEGWLIRLEQTCGRDLVQI